jgi:protein phosphatase
MAPVEASNEPDLLEHPDEAFAYYRHQGVHQVVCEQKHMGSRAIAIVCRNTSVPRKRFGVPAETLGVVYTRTGRRFFNDPAWEAALLQHLRDAATAAGLWDALDTDWLLLDAELMPWSAKAQELLRLQYAPTAAAGIVALQAALAIAPDELQPTLQARLDALQRYRDAYRRYCWQVRSPDDLRFAPFHLLAPAVRADSSGGYRGVAIGTCDCPRRTATHPAGAAGRPAALPRRLPPLLLAGA